MNEQHAVADTLIPYSLLVQQFREAPPGKLYCLHGHRMVFRLSLAAAAHALLNGVPVTLVDGTNRFDVYYLAEFARAMASQRAGPHAVRPEQILHNIYVSRAFTCFQMEAVVTERLPAFLAERRSPVAVIFGLLDTFYDDQAPLFEVNASVQRIIAALHRLKQANISVLLASTDVQNMPPQRKGLFPRLAAAMDRVYAVSETEGMRRIVWERTPRRTLRGDPVLPPRRRAVA